MNPAVLLIEFVVPQRYQCGRQYPSLFAALKNAAIPTRWLRFGLRPDVQFHRDEVGIGLDETDLKKLLQAIAATSASHLLFSEGPSDSLICSIKASAPHLELATLGEVSTRETRELPRRIAPAREPLAEWLDIDMLPELDTEDFGFETANALAAEAAPILFLDLDRACLHRPPLRKSHFFARRESTGFPKRWGCAFCTGPRTDTLSPKPLDHSLERLRRALESARKTHPNPKELCYRVSGYRLTQAPIALAKTVASAGVVAGSRFLLDYRADDIVELEAELARAATIMGEIGHTLEVCLVGIESFSARQLDRYAKGYGPATNLAAIRVLRSLEARYPGAFEFRRHRGLSTILFDPWTSLGDVALNLAVARLFDLESLLGKLLTSRIRLEEGLPLTLAAEEDGLLTETFADPLFETARLNFYQPEIPWTFRNKEVEELCRLLIRFAPESPRSGDPLGQRIAAWEEEEPLKPLERAERVVRHLADRNGEASAEELLDECHRAGPRKKPDIQLSLVDELLHDDLDTVLNLNIDLFAFRLGVKKLVKVEGTGGAETIASTRAELERRYPDATILSRSGQALGTHDWELFISHDPQRAVRALAATRQLEIEKDEAHAHELIVELGELLGYPKCCARAFAEAPLALRSSNEWLWLRRRLHAPTELPNPLLHPLLLSHVPCSLECERSLELVETLFSVPDQTTLKQLGRAPTILLLDRCREGFVLSAKPRENETFPYSLAAVSTRDPRLSSVNDGERLSVSPGLLEVEGGAETTAIFPLDAFFWWWQDVFHRSFWEECLLEIESAPRRDSPPDPHKKQRQWLAKLLERLLDRLAQNPEALRGFTPGHPAVVAHPTDTGWGELCVRFTRGNEPLMLTLREEGGFEHPFLELESFALVHDEETPLDSEAKRFVATILLRGLQRQVDRGS